MEWKSIVVQAMNFIQKNRYLILAVVAGILLMSIPDSHVSQDPPESEVTTEHAEQSLEEDLAEILEKMEGAGKVRVLLTLKEGERILYQADENHSVDAESEDRRTETVILTGAERKEDGLVVQVTPPIYLGAIVLCQGANRAEIRLSIVEAVMDATGLTSDKITVLKMK